MKYVKVDDYHEMMGSIEMIRHEVNEMLEYYKDPDLEGIINNLQLAQDTAQSLLEEALEED